MTWTIWKGVRDEPVEIIANSFDEALAKARELSPDYDSGQVKEGE